MATRALRAMATRATRATATATPTLRQSMTALVRLVHPDVLAATHPEHARANGDALAHLQGTLDDARGRGALPGARVRRLRFYVRDDARAEGVRDVGFTLRTTGGDCRNVMRRDLGALFAQVGIEREFEWGEGDWGATRTETEAEDEGARGRGEGETSRSSETPEVAQAYREQTTTNAGGGGTRTRDVHEALKALDPAFEGVAAVAWLRDASENADEGERKRIVMFEVIPHLVREGWNLKGETLEAIWRGERDEKVLLDGLDGGSALAVVSILKHTKNLERMYGPAPRKD
jgi:hypothetical protein|tara:strand:- start:7839 stop:8708 length:870 start_codon:yes stop_codon:yes gene_type:complete